MNTEQEISYLKDQLVACFGNYVTVLSKKTQLSRPMITRFFSHRPLSVTHKVRIYRAALVLIAKCKKEEARVSQQVKKLTHEPGDGTPNTAFPLTSG